MTEEHLIPAWVFRAVQRRRRPKVNVLRHHLPGGEQDEYHGPRQETAKIVCRACNTGWISVLDDAASRVLKPLIRGEGRANLNQADQLSIAAWALKIAVVGDVAARFGRSRLREHAPALREVGEPPDFFEVWHGPPSFEPREGLAVFGLTPNEGKLVLGKKEGAEVVPLLSWSLMLGYCDLLLRPLFHWIPLDDPPRGFQRLWPGVDSMLCIEPDTGVLAADVHCIPVPSWPGVVVRS